MRSINYRRNSPLLFPANPLEIQRLEAKFKLGQDEPRKDVLAVAAHLAASADPTQRKLAEMVRRANADRPEDGAS